MIDEPAATNRARYAINAMIEIARAEKAVPLHIVAAATDISLSYLEQLAAALRLHCLLDAKLGPRGGYFLAKPPADITIAEIVTASEDWAPGKKTNSEKSAAPQKPTDKLWDHVSKLIILQLRHITLQDVMDVDYPADKFIP